jgi:hypothetical protein
MKRAKNKRITKAFDSKFSTIQKTHWAILVIAL